MVITTDPASKHSVNVWSLFGQYLVNIRLIFGQHLVDIWSTFGQYSVNVCLILGQHLVNIWSRFGQYLVNIRSIFVSILPVVRRGGVEHTWSTVMLGGCGRALCAIVPGLTILT